MPSNTTSSQSERLRKAKSCRTVSKQKGGDLKHVKHVLRRKVKNTIKDASTLITVLQNGQDLSLKRRVGVYPPQMRRLLEKVGNEPVSSLTVARAPIQSAVKTLLNVISLGAYEKAVKDSNYDSMFHLSLFINDRYTLDKQQTVKFVEGRPPSNAEVKQVALTSPLTISELINRTKEIMGPKAFSTYDAHTNNCQDFILAVLGSNGFMTDELKSFIKQDADAVFRKLPSLSEKIAGFLTDAGATLDRIVEGEGEKKPKKHPKKKAKTVTKVSVKSEPPTSWSQYISQHTKGKKFASREAVRDNMKRLSEEFKALKSQK